MKFVRGVGPQIAELLAEKSIQTAEDLLYHLPFRYEDRQNPRSLDELKPGEVASVIGEVRGSALLRTRRMPLFELTVGQGRFALKCVWFNSPYLKDKFQAGQTIAVYGKVEPSRSSSNLKMIQPQFEILPDASADAETRLLEVGRITPVLRIAGRQPPGIALATQDHLQPARKHRWRRARVPTEIPARSPQPF